MFVNPFASKEATTTTTSSSSSSPPTTSSRSNGRRNETSRRGNNNNNNDDEDEDDLSNALENLDIDRDFNALASSDTSNNNKSRNNNNNNFPPLSKADKDDIQYWKSRVQRDEVYSLQYRPVPREDREVQQLAEDLGLKKAATSSNTSSSSNSSSNVLLTFQQAVTTTVSTLQQQMTPIAGAMMAAGGGGGTSPAEAEVLRTLLDPTATGGDGPSIVLKRGTILWTKAGDQQQQQQQRELILLTHGILVHKTAAAAAAAPEQAPSTPPPSTTSPKSSSSSSSTSSNIATNFLSQLTKLPSLPTSVGVPAVPNAVAAAIVPTKPFEFVCLSKQVVQVKAMDPVSFDIQITDNTGNSSNSNTTTNVTTTTTYSFTCGHPLQQQAWLDALERSVIPARTRLMPPPKDEEDDDDDEEEDDPWDLGWQHRVIQRGIFTPAVTGNTALLQEFLQQQQTTNSSSRISSLLDTLDDYQAWSPLHYATYHNHETVVRLLLQAGANPNIPEGAAMVSSSSSNKSRRDYSRRGVPAGVRRTPMDLAIRFRFYAIQSWLETYGGRSHSTNNNNSGGSPKSSGSDHGSTSLLRHAAAAVEDSKSKSRGTSAARSKATTSTSTTTTTTAAGSMQHTMAAMQERGERIDRLDAKTRELQQNAQEYRETARTIKEQAMQKKWYNPF